MLLWLWLATVASAADPEMIPYDLVDIVGKPAPAMKVEQRGGGEWNLDQHRGRVIVASFWASWCSPCRLELPAMTEMAAKRTDIDWVAVNVDRERSAAEAFLRKVQVGIPIVFDNDALLMGDFNVMSMPTTFVIGKDGTVAYRKVGFNQEKGLTELMQHVDEALKQR
jgi:thiol-disulfide isomerase/thioredoxin